MASGKVKWFNATKGFGFIEPDDGGKDVFVHVTAVKEAGIAELPDNQRVEFELINDERRGRVFAGNIKLI